MLNVLLFAPMIDQPRQLRRELERATCECRVFTEGEIGDDAVDVIIVDDYTDAQRRQFPTLRAVLSLSAGVDSLLTQDAFADVPIARLVTTDHQQLMREYVLYHVLRSRGQFGDSERQQRERQWQWLPPARPVASKKALVLGNGFLGTSAAIALRDLGLSVRTWSRSGRVVKDLSSISGDEALLDALKETDYLVCILPLTEQTRYLLNAARLAHLPSHAVLINASRAGCVELRAIVKMLTNGTLAGAVLDVFDEEPVPPHSVLWTVPNLTITPHIAAVPDRHAYIPVIAKALSAIATGVEMPYIVDRHRGY